MTWKQFYAKARLFYWLFYGMRWYYLSGVIIGQVAIHELVWYLRLYS